jgi:hypothetical protein
LVGAGAAPRADVILQGSGFAKAVKEVALSLVQTAAASTNGTPAEQRYAAALFSVFPSLKSAGVYSRRKILGSTTWSQHAWGNAIDVVGGTTEMNAGANWSFANRANYNIAHLLWQGRNMINGLGVYDHFNHFHSDFNPQGTGTPPVLHNGGRVFRSGLHRLQQGEHVINPNSGRSVDQLAMAIEKAQERSGRKASITVNVAGKVEKPEDIRRSLDWWARSTGW